MDEVDTNKKPFRILCLDGGGIRGVITARMLQEVERQVRERHQQSLGEYFDLIAGTSTGSLLASAICMGYSPEELIRLYRDNGRDIFPYQKLTSPARWGLILKYGPSAPKFSNAGLIDVLTGLPMFQNNGKPILLKEVGKGRGEDPPHPILLILAYDATYRNTTFFTNFHPAFAEKWYDNLPLWRICVASAAAPTYFPAYELSKTEIGKTETGERVEEFWSFPHVDGGVTANNPALCAIAQAIMLGHRLEDIELLSLGTGQNRKPLSFNEIEGWGLVQWGMRIADVFMEGQAELQSEVCSRLMGGKSSNRYLRLQFDLNDSLGEPRNRLAQPTILPNNKRKNRLLGKQLSESMDDASPENIDRLLEAARLYIEKGKLYDGRFEHYGSVKSAIKDFMNAPAGVRIRHPKKGKSHNSGGPEAASGCRRQGFWDRFATDRARRGFSNARRID